MSDALDDDEVSAYFALISAGDLLQRAVAAQLAPFAITPLQFTLLAHLLEAPDGLRMGEIADALVALPSGITYQIGQLEKAGLVERVASPSDDRAVVARLLPAGRERVLDALPGHVTLVRSSFLDHLEPGELATIREALERVSDRLRQS